VERPLTALFVDCDSYFASVEQHLDPSLRGRPVAVAPVVAEFHAAGKSKVDDKTHGFSVTRTHASPAWP
jgi:DNA polymerase-4